MKTITEHIGAGKEDPAHPVRFIVKWKVHEYYAEAEAFEAVYTDIIEDALLPKRERRGPALVTEVDGEPVIDVTIKWDGCANWGMSTRGLAMHTCGSDEVQALAEMLVYLHRRAGELIPNAESPWGD